MACLVGRLQLPWRGVCLYNGQNDFFYLFCSSICTEKSRKLIKKINFYFIFSSCIKEEALSNRSAVNNRWINYSKLPSITKGLPYTAKVFPQTLFFLIKKGQENEGGGGCAKYAVSFVVSAHLFSNQSAHDSAS